MAAVLVMLFHYGFWVGAYPEGEAHSISQGLIAFPAFYDWTEFGWVGVQVFFVISGFVIAFSAERAANAYAFFVTRFVRLFPAALVCATISLIAALLVGYAEGGDLITAYLRSVLFIPFGAYIDGSYWTLCIEVAFYGLVFGLIAIGRFQWLRGLAIVLGLQSTVFWTIYALAATQPDSGLFALMRHLQDSRITELLLLHHGCFFALGIFLWLHLFKQKSRSNIFCFLLFTAAGCLQIHGVILSFYHRYHLMQPEITPLLLWLAAMAGIIAAIVRNDLVSRMPAWAISGLRRMGLMTYPLYLLHQTAGLAFMGGLARMGVQPVSALFITIVTAFAAAWLVSALLEPPLQNLCKTMLLKLKARWEQRAANKDMLKA